MKYCVWHENDRFGFSNVFEADSHEEALLESINYGGGLFGVHYVIEKTNAREIQRKYVISGIVPDCDKEEYLHEIEINSYKFNVEIQYNITKEN